ncbi:MAG TPA: SSI family serine proteinase inhibitor, partial [Steroidobacteraceae bacterium]|nr:SSI family serine proteinase inhibitor [Steroidobacteraceae bacterium]
KKEAACEALRSVDGEFGRITSRPQICTMIYQPVDVTANGTWRGKPVKFAATYASRCSADADSRGIFDF